MQQSTKAEELFWNGLALEKGGGGTRRTSTGRLGYAASKFNGFNKAAREKKHGMAWQYENRT